MKNANLSTYLSFSGHLQGYHTIYIYLKNIYIFCYDFFFCELVSIYTQLTFSTNFKF